MNNIFFGVFESSTDYNHDIVICVSDFLQGIVKEPAPYFLINVAYQDELDKSHQALTNTDYFLKFNKENLDYLKTTLPKEAE